MPDPGRPMITRTGVGSSTKPICFLVHGEPAMSSISSVRRRQVQIVAEGAGLERRVVVVVSHVPDDDGVLRQVEALGARARGRRPPQVVLHAVVAAQRGPAPALALVRAALHDSRPAVGGEVLEHDAQPPVEMGPAPQSFRDVRVHLEREAHLGGVLAEHHSARRGRAAGLGLSGPPPGPAVRRASCRWRVSPPAVSCRSTARTARWRARACGPSPSCGRFFSTPSARLDTSPVSRFRMRASCWIVFGVRMSILGILSFLMFESGSLCDAGFGVPRGVDVAHARR